MQLSDIGTIKDLLSRHGFSFSKALGQNFLINPSVCPRMAEMSGADEKTGALEIGPGIGVLTAELAKRAKKTVAIELDKRLFPILDETLAEYDNVKIIHGDVLKLNLHEIIETEFSDCESVCVCANLPYYITSPVIMALLEQKLPIKRITVMVQKEAADRLCAQTGTRECGAVTLAVRHYAEPRLLFKVSRGSFMPAPNVDSAVIGLDIHDSPMIEVKNEQYMFKVIKAGFGQRRKNLLNSLSSGLALPKEKISKALETAKIKPNARAEELSLEDFAYISDLLDCH